MSNCKNWNKGKNRQGYGQRWFQGRNTLAHRAAYCEHHGLSLEAIKGLVIRHTCDNPSCVNPDHLLSGTHKENMEDMVRRGRASRKGSTRVKRLGSEDDVLDLYQEDPSRHPQTIACRVNRSESFVRKTLKKFMITQAV